MLLGDVKLEALRLMFINMDKTMTIDSLPDLYNDSIYAMYLTNMTGAINRAIDRIVSAKVLPMKYKVLTKSDGQELGNRTIFDLSKKVDDFYDLISIDMLSNNKYAENIPFVQMTNTEIILKIEDGTQILVIYNPKIAHIDGMQDSAMLNLPDEISSIIPYYIKSDLYQEDNASLANDARNKFESGLASFAKAKKESNYKICKKFGLRFF